jgi:hypothetical protein
MPVRHLLVWLAAGAACWSVLTTAVLIAPQTLLALGALLALPWLRRPQALTVSGGPLLVQTPAAEIPGDHPFDDAIDDENGRRRDDAQVLVAQSA